MCAEFSARTSRGYHQPRINAASPCMGLDCGTIPFVDTTLPVLFLDCTASSSAAAATGDAKPKEAAWSQPRGYHPFSTKNGLDPCELVLIHKLLVDPQVFTAFVLNAD